MTDFEVREIQEFLEQKIRGITPGNLSLKGLAGSAVYFPIASFVNKAPCRIHVLILENSTEASYAAADLSVLLGYERVYLFPASYRGTGKTARPDESFQVQRTMALGAVAGYYKKPSDILLVTYPKALQEGIPGKNNLDTGHLDVKKGQTISHQDIKETLFQAGFEKTDFVSEPGQFAIRGSILDVFSYAENRPYRINFFGDQVENIRIFDQNTQLSIEERHTISIIPRLEGEQSLLGVIQNNALVWLFHESAGDIPQNIPVISINPLADEGQKVLYQTTPQPVINKNFNLLVKDIQTRKEKGYRVFILSENRAQIRSCLLYTSDAADDLLCVDLGGRRIIKKKNNI